MNSNFRQIGAKTIECKDWGNRVTFALRHPRLVRVLAFFALCVHATTAHIVTKSDVQEKQDAIQ